MPRLRVHNMCVSVDGFAAGPDQDLDHPLGVGAEPLHRWIFETPWGARMIGRPTDGMVATLDDEFLARGEQGIGATIMGRNMFGPVRAGWDTDPDWTGWWGPTPPFHHDVFVLTHHARDPLTMEGGTTFHFVTDGIESALERATAAAGDLDIRLGGGASTVQQYLRAGLVDELNLALVPVALGRGERLLGDGVVTPDGYEVAEVVPTDRVTNIRIVRR